MKWDGVPGVSAFPTAGGAGAEVAGAVDIISIREVCVFKRPRKELLVGDDCRSYSSEGWGLYVVSVEEVKMRGSRRRSRGGGVGVLFYYVCVCVREFVWWNFIV